MLGQLLPHDFQIVLIETNGLVGAQIENGPAIGLPMVAIEAKNRRAGAQIAQPGAVELAPAAADAAAVQAVVQRITKLGANVGRDAAGRIVAVNLMFCPATDDDLKAISLLADLQRLTLYGAEISDAGVACLKGLPKLKDLTLYNTNISDAGMEELPPSRVCNRSTSNAARTSPTRPRPH